MEGKPSVVSVILDEVVIYDGPAGNDFPWIDGGDGLSGNGCEVSWNLGLDLAGVPHRFCCATASMACRVCSRSRQRVADSPTP